MKPVPILIALAAPLLLAACAGGTSNPVFNTAAKKAYIYSPHEKQGGIVKRGAIFSGVNAR